MELTPLQKKLGLIDSGDDIEHRYICHDMLLTVCQTKGADWQKMLAVATGSAVGLILEGIVDVLAKGDLMKYGKRAPWSRSKISQAEEFLADYEKKAIAELTAILEVGNENSTRHNVLENLGLAITFLWSLHDEAFAATKKSVATKQITVRRDDTPKPRPTDLA